MPSRRVRRDDGTQRIRKGSVRVATSGSDLLGDAGDVFPGAAANTAVSPTTTPSSTSHLGRETAVASTDISSSAATMSAFVRVNTPQ